MLKLSRYNVRNFCKYRVPRGLNVISHRKFWIPPIPPPLLRLLMRPVAVIFGGMFVGMVLQLWKGGSFEQNKFLSAHALSDEGNVIKYGKWIQRGTMGIGIIAFLWLTRLRNPLWADYLGTTEYNLQLAESEGRKPGAGLWGDSRSASDTMKTRVKSMERYLAIALSSIEADKNGEEIHRINERVNAIRTKGYSNAVAVSLQRALFWGETGDIENFEKALSLIDYYCSQGGRANTTELNRVKSVGYSTKCHLLLAEAELKATQGDVSGCSGAIRRIQQILEKCDTQVNCGIRNEELTATLQRAHVNRVFQLLDSAKNARKHGSRSQANQFIEQAKKYAITNHIAFDDEQAKLILN